MVLLLFWVARACDVQLVNMVLSVITLPSWTMVVGD